jgi:hypothetical protein
VFYNGGGTGRVAAVILADALDLADLVEGGIALSSYTGRDAPAAAGSVLRGRAVADVRRVRLRRGAVCAERAAGTPRRASPTCRPAVASLPQSRDQGFASRPRPVYRDRSIGSLVVLDRRCRISLARCAGNRTPQIDSRTRSV